MTILERYIFKIAASAFLVCLAGMTVVIWLASALKEMDLVSGKGQTILMLLKVTLLTVPALVMIIAPVALFVAVLYALNKLNGDSELIVMNAAGMSPIRVARPLVALALLTAALVGYITIVAMPASFRELRDLVTKIRADVVTKFLQEGRFTTLDKGITFHFREKAPGGAMLGIMIHDARDAARQTTYLAERGQIVEANGGAYIVLEEGSLHRKTSDSRGGENAIVAYKRYALDLEQFSPGADNIVYKPRERSTLELLRVDPNELYAQINAGRFRAELHERFAAPLHALATFMIAFAALGTARTTRQGRGLAIVVAVAAVVALRILAFAASSLAIRSGPLTAMIYAVPLGATLAAGAVFWRAAGSTGGGPAWARIPVEAAARSLAELRARLASRRVGGMALR